MPFPPQTALSDAPASKPISVRPIFFGYIADIVLPTLFFFVLQHFGVSDVISLGAGIAIALITTLANTVRRKKLDRIGIIVLLEITLSIVLLFTLHDRRLLLAKPSFYSALIGVYIIVGAFPGQPINYEAIRSIGSDGDPARAAAFDAAWQNSPRFRNALRTSAVGWGVAFLADAIIRIVIVYKTPFTTAMWLSNAPHFAAILLLVAFSAAMGRVTKRLVDEQIEKRA